MYSECAQIPHHNQVCAKVFGTQEVNRHVAASWQHFFFVFHQGMHRSYFIQIKRK